jgi:hypothetical protein
MSSRSRPACRRHPAGFQAALPVWIEAGPWRRYDIRSHAGVMAGVLRHYGPGTRVRFHGPAAEQAVDPLYHRAWQLLSSSDPT